MDPLTLMTLLLVIAARITDCGAEAVPTTSASGESFVFNGFPQGNLTTGGATMVLGSGLLQLTNHTQTTTGRAFYHIPFRFKSGGSMPGLLSFSTTFVFAIVPTLENYQAGTHGMAFVVSPSTNLTDDSDGRNLGMFKTSTLGNASNHIFAIEFDLTSGGEFKEISGYHIGIDVNGLISFNASRAGYYATEASNNLTDMMLPSGEAMQLWLDYDAGKMLVEVTLAPLNVSAVGGRPKKPLLSTKISNLTDVFLDDMYVGFTAATGRNGPLAQYVLGWSFKLGGGPAPTLDLSKLPKLPKRKPSKQLPTLLAILLPVATAIVLLVAVSAAWLVWQRKKKFEEVLEDWEVELYGPHRFSYKDLYLATKGFALKELLGTGGFGAVYRGVFRSSQTEIAVKRVSHESRQGIREFVAEVVTIGRLRHRNLVQLLGYCRRKGELLLVYDYMPNGSLDALLYGDQSGDSNHNYLAWNQRVHVIKGVGAALRYLHEEWDQVVIHRDVKPSNVLLDRDFNARLGDFGLSRLYDHGTLPRTTHVVGTMGYIAPDLAKEGKATEATDVFAFGVLLLEVVCGRRPIEPAAPREEVVLVDWILRGWMNGAKLVDCRDGRLLAEETYDDVQAELLLKLGLLCAHALPESRPNMRQVMQILDGDLQLPEVSSDYWSGTIPTVEPKGRFDDFLTKSNVSCSSAVLTGAGDSSYFLSGGR